VQLAIGLLVTFTAIVLGLLTTSVKSGFDAAYNARGAYAGQLAQLDRCLRDYGPETQRTREQLRGYVAAIIASTWPSEPPPTPTGVAYPDASRMPRTGESTVLADLLNEIGLEIQTLQPTDSLHRNLMNSCAAQYADLLELRWIVIEGVHASISAPFYWVLVFWLLILFGSFGLRAPPNTLSIIVIALCAISVTSAIFVILDMDLPYGGLFGIPEHIDAERAGRHDALRNRRSRQDARRAFVGTVGSSGDQAIDGVAALVQEAVAKIAARAAPGRPSGGDKRRGAEISRNANADRHTSSQRHFPGDLGGDGSCLSPCGDFRLSFSHGDAVVPHSGPNPQLIESRQ
jgi:hypothetical protein